MSINQLQPIGGGRIKYLDTLRGFTMLLVVYQHVRNFGLGDLPVEDSSLALFFIAFRMPMFFFISGYIAYKHFSFWTVESYKKRLTTKMRVQLIPTIVFFSILWYLQLHPQWNFPGGFWFTEVLFEMFIIYFTIALLSKRVKGKTEEIVLVTIALGLFFIKGVFVKFPNLQFLCLRELGTYFVFFTFGLLCKKHNDVFQSLTMHRWVITGCVIIPLLLLGAAYGPLHMPLNHGLAGPVQLVNGICLVVVIFSMFRNSAEYWNRSGVIQRCFEYIGRRTLDIYMLHYFFIPVLPTIGLYFRESTNSDVVEFFVVGVLTLMITAVVLLTSAFLRMSPILAKYLFGVSPKNPKPSAPQIETVVSDGQAADSNVK